MAPTCLRAAALGVLLGLIWIAPARSQSDAEKIRLIDNEAAGWSRNMDLLLGSFPFGPTSSGPIAHRIVKPTVARMSWQMWHSDYASKQDSADLAGLIDLGHSHDEATG